MRLSGGEGTGTRRGRSCSVSSSAVSSSRTASRWPTSAFRRSRRCSLPRASDIPRMLHVNAAKEKMQGEAGRSMSLEEFPWWHCIHRWRALPLPLPLPLPLNLPLPLPLPHPHPHPLPLPLPLPVSRSTAAGVGHVSYTSVARSRSESSSVTAVALQQQCFLLLVVVFYAWVARSRSGSSSFTASALNKPSSSSYSSSSS